jgi:sugar (pentulose or hexulose) kinase
MIEDATGASVREFVAVGGGAASDLWCQIMADATGRSIRRSATLEASSLGAAVCAAVGAGIYGTAIEAAAAMSGQALRETNPDPDNRATYADLLGIYRELYPSLRQTFAKLAGRATT